MRCFARNKNMERLKYACLLIATLVSILPATAQQQNPPLSGRASLQRLAESYRAGAAQRSVTILRLAKEKKWPLIKQLPGGGVLNLQRTDELGLPIYKITTSNIRSAATTSTDLLWPGGSSGLALRGADETLSSRLGIWDGGAILTTHQELVGRINRKDDPLPVNEHATHVAGSLIAAGINRLAKGMAFGAPDLVAYDFLEDNVEMAEEAAMLLISNHSYGALAGWHYNQGQSRWEWYGQPQQTDDYKFGYYDITAREWDEIAWNAPYYLIVKSAGNNRNINGPEEGGPYYRFNEDGIMAPAPAGAPFPSPNSGYDVLPLYATAKNILLVGAVNPVPEGYRQPADVVMPPFSSWGPTDDGRIKPDIMGNGLGVLSTSSDADDAYTVLSGTSMAAPNVSGSLLLLQELYARRHKGRFMRSATLRGLVIHTASQAGPAPGPDYRFGWGLLNTKKAADLILNDSASAIILEDSITQGGSVRHEVVASGYEPLEVSICWTDPEADPIPEEQALDNPAPRLVNDLDIRVSSPQDSTVFYPWILDPAQPQNAARRGDNTLDNVEKVLVTEPGHGKSYTIQVSHKNKLLRGPQAYSLIVSGAGGNTYCSSRPADSTGVSITGFQAGTLNYKATGQCGAYTDLLNDPVQTGPGVSMPFSLQTDFCTGGGSEHIIKLFADWDANGDFNGKGELLAESPVLSAAGTYIDSIRIPDTLPSGTFVRLRVVVAGTSTAGEVLPCGTYPSGETLDASIEIVPPRQDLAIEALRGPGPDGFCPGTDKQVSVLLRNRGTAAISDFPLNVEILEDETSVASMEGRFKGTLPPGDTAVYTFPYYFTAAPAKTYTFSFSAYPEGDQLTANNRLTGSRSSGPATAAPRAVQALLCDSGQEAVLLSNSAGADRAAGTLYWYDQPRGGRLLGAGDTVTTAYAGAAPVFYAAFNDFRGQIGPVSKQAQGASSAADAYDQHAAALIINTEVPLVIESTRMYTGNAGEIAIVVYDSRGMEIARSLQYAGASRNEPAAGPLPDDPLDTGGTYFLNLRIPRPGRYRIQIDYRGSGATLFRNRARDTNAADKPGSSPYPVRIPGIMSITGTTADESDGYYYYFYDIKVRATGCPSARVSVDAEHVPPPRITRSGDTLFTGSGPPLQWYLNGEVLEGATQERLHAKVSGSYQVSTRLGDCLIFSEPFSFLTLDELIAGMENNGLKIYPNPMQTGSQPPLTVEFYAKEQDNVELRLVDMLGKLIYREEPALQNGRNRVQFRARTFAPGMYILVLHINEDQFSQKLIIH